MVKSRNMKKIIIFLALLLCVISSYSRAYAAISFHLDFGQDGYYESMWPLSSGELVSIDIYVSGVPDPGLRAMGFVLNYDFNKFQIIPEGTFVNDVWTEKYLDNTVPGKIDVAGFKLDAGVVGVGGKDIKLATIKIRRLQSGRVDLILTNRGGTIDSFVLADQQGTVLDGDIPEGGAVLSTIIEKGDTNTDGTINLGDAISVLKLMARIYIPANHRIADVNGDGKIGLAEAIYVLQCLAGFRAPTTTYTISGKISANGAALPGVTVTLSGATIATAKTNPHGYYTFTGLLNGNYIIKPLLAVIPGKTVTVTNDNVVQDFIVLPGAPRNLRIVSEGHGGVTLQWDKSFSDPYLQSYKVYYYTTPGNPESLNPEDYAVAYMLPGGYPIDISLGGPKPITIDRDNTQITLNFINSSKHYYYAVTAVDTRGLEGIPTREVSMGNLQVEKPGAGAGTVTGSPSGIDSAINCGTYCRAYYAPGTSVTLTAADIPGSSTFTGWSGGGCSGTGPTCNVTTINEKITVTATFSPLRRLDVMKAGAGTGTVTGLPLGISSVINCGTGCASDSADYPDGMVVTLTATPDPGYIFTGWSGGCSGTEPCVVTMNAAKSVTATFSPLRRLDVVKAGIGTGTVTGSPSGISSDINCGTGCPSDSADYPDGMGVTLTATPDPGYIFTGWSGGCVGTVLMCVVTMDAAKSIMVTFAPL